MPRPPKRWFLLLTFITYLAQIEFETGFEYPGNCNRIYPVPKQGNAANQITDSGLSRPISLYGKPLCSKTTKHSSYAHYMVLHLNDNLNTASIGLANSFSGQKLLTLCSKTMWQSQQSVRTSIEFGTVVHRYNLLHPVSKVFWYKSEFSWVNYIEKVQNCYTQLSSHNQQILL